MERDEQILRLLEDLEGQADALFREERDEEVAERAEAGYAEVTLLARLHASVGRSLRVGLTEGPDLSGKLSGCGEGWILLTGHRATWLVPVPAMTRVTGMAAGAVPEVARARSSRLGLGSVLRRWADQLPGCVLLLRGGRHLEGALERVGADFVVLGTSAGDVEVPFSALVALRGG